MSNIIDKIQLSGVTYDIGGSGGTVSSAITSGDTNAVAGGAVYDKFDEVEQVTAAALNALNTNKQDKLSAGTGISISGNVISATGGGGGNPTVELTQAEYDALVSAGTVSADTYYIITDATPVDMSNYYTTAQTNTLLAEKQDTLSAGRGISIANDTISFSLPISAGTGTNSIKENYTSNTASGSYSHAEGYKTKATGSYSHAEGYNAAASADFTHAEGYNTKASANYTHAEGQSTQASGVCSHAEGGASLASGLFSHAEGYYTNASGQYSHVEGNGTSATSQSSHAEGYYANASGQYSHAEGYSTSASGSCSHAEGQVTRANNQSEHASGQFNVSTKASNTFGDSGNTLFSVGNGTADDARHNAFEIRQNGDIYITSGNTDIKLQDHLGGGTVSSAITSGDTNAVAGGAVYDKFDEVEQVTAAALNNLNDKFDGLRLLRLTQAEYDALSGSTDSNTLYVIVN